MAVDRHGSRVMHREIALPDGAKAGFWLEPGTTVRMNYHSANGGGQSNWDSCGDRDCVGIAMASGWPCFAHGEDSQRQVYAERARGGKGAFNLSGIRLTGETWMVALEYLRPNEGLIDFPVMAMGTYFPSRVLFRNTTFSKGAHFFGATFEDGFEFDTCEFSNLDLSYSDSRRGPGYAHGCTVTGSLSARCIHTEQQVSYSDGSIHGDVWCEGASDIFRLENCTVKGTCDFSKSAARMLMLSNTRIGGDLNLEGACPQSFHGAGLQLDASVQGTLRTTDCDLTRARFETRVLLRVCAQSVNLAGAHFLAGGRLDVDNAKVSLASVTSSAPLVVSGQGAASLTSLNSADAGMLTLSGIALDQCIFYGAHDLPSINIEPTVRLPRPPKGRARRRCTYDEVLWRQQSERMRSSDWKPSVAQDAAEVADRPTLTASQVAGVYRALRKSLESQSNEAATSDFYYGEMEMRRADQAATLSEKVILTAYWLVSGYGLRALRAVLALCVLVAAGSVALHVWGLPDSTWSNASLTAVESVVPGFRLPADLTESGRATILVLRVIGPVLLALAALALRNRVKR